MNRNPQPAFTFGENWLDFSTTLDPPRVAAAEDSVRALLQRPRLDGLTFLDLGAGSGLFLIAAFRLEAARVVAGYRDVNCLERRCGRGSDPLCSRVPPSVAVFLTAGRILFITHSTGFVDWKIRFADQ